MLVVLCPSRSRPAGAAEVMQTFKDTAADLDTKLIFLVDPDDETGRDYPSSDEEPVVSTFILPQRFGAGMLPPLNGSLPYVLTPETSVVGFVGDDHRFRTEGWDVAIEEVLEKTPGVAYGDDLLKRETLPSQWFISRPIVDVFRMGHESLQHLYIDDYWKTLASNADCLYYLPQVVIEHMHPTAGKSEWDDGYRRVNSSDMYAADSAVFNGWRDTRLANDAVTLRGIVSSARAAQDLSDHLDLQQDGAAVQPSPAVGDEPDAPADGGHRRSGRHGRTRADGAGAAPH